jgi:hypothetical protein
MEAITMNEQEKAAKRSPVFTRELGAKMEAYGFDMMRAWSDQESNCMWSIWFARRAPQTIMVQVFPDGHTNYWRRYDTMDEAAR